MKKSTKNEYESVAGWTARFGERQRYMKLWSQAAMQARIARKRKEKTKQGALDRHKFMAANFIFLTVCTLVILFSFWFLQCNAMFNSSSFDCKYQYFIDTAVSAMQTPADVICDAQHNGTNIRLIFQILCYKNDYSLFFSFFFSFSSYSTYAQWIVYCVSWTWMWSKKIKSTEISHRNVNKSSKYFWIENWTVESQTNRSCSKILNWICIEDCVLECWSVGADCNVPIIMDPNVIVHVNWCQFIHLNKLQNK